MRLLNTKYFVFRDFFENNLPPYAILSHTWGNDEVIYSDLRKGTATGGLGMAKIEATRKLAARNDIEWVWIDTCCIDKKSSAEVSEAINAMYRWYEKATVCYAYLSDVNITESRDITQSVWFTRGWTLQELLASSSLVFYDSQWQEIGSKQELSEEVSVATGISQDNIKSFTAYWHHKGSRKTACVATRMSWASKRQTSCPEDIAYCLLGIFDVNMSLLYGEGKTKAFIRLQKKIIQKLQDETIFAWGRRHSSKGIPGLLAPHPEFFADSDVFRSSWDLGCDLPWTMTCQGLQITLEPGSWTSLTSNKTTGCETIIIDLKCKKKGAKRNETCGLMLERDPRSIAWHRCQYRIKSKPHIKSAGGFLTGDIWAARPRTEPKTICLNVSAPSEGRLMGWRRVRTVQDSGLKLLG